MNIKEWPLQSSETIAELYWNNYDRIANRFAYHPWEEGILERRVRDLEQQSMRADRDALADHLITYNREIGNSASALARIEQLRDPNTLVVVGGQQAGLLTGPALVIYKAITIIQEAKRAQEALHRPVVPVFWIAGEDHDYAEVNHTYFLQQAECIKLEIERESDRTPVSNIPISAKDWDELLHRLEEALQPTEFKPQLLDKLQHIADTSTTMTDFFAKMMVWLFHDYGLVLLDSHHEELRRIQAPFFELLIKEHKSLNEAFCRGAEEVKQLGFTPQAQVQPNGVNVFKIKDGQRLLLYRDGEWLTDRQKQHKWSHEQLLAAAADEPKLLSNNVLTRPLMQQYLFPVLSTVLGPGELSYWALLKEGFDHVHMTMPILTPRVQITLVEGIIQKHMDKFGWGLADVTNHYEEKRQAWLQAQDELKLDERFTKIKSDFAKMYQPLLDAAASVHPGMKQLGSVNMQKINEQIDFMQKRSQDAYEQQYEASLRQMDRIYQSIMPLDKPQERVFNILYFLNKYGLPWLHQLVEKPFSVQTGRYRIYI